MFYGNSKWAGDVHITKEAVYLFRRCAFCKQDWTIVEDDLVFDGSIIKNHGVLYEYHWFCDKCGQPHVEVIPAKVGDQMRERRKNKAK